MAESVTVNRVVVHQLDKPRGKNESKLITSNGLLPIDNQTVELVNKLNDSYRAQRIIYGVFDTNPDKKFPRYYNTYQENPTDESFITSTIEMAELLRSSIVGITQASGGYLVFCEYEFYGNTFFAVFLLRNVDSFLFEKKGEKFEINPTQHLEIDQLAMAGRVNRERFVSKNGSHLTFVYRRQSDISDYFIEWISAKEIKSNKIYTRNVYNLFMEIELPVDENGREIDRDDFTKSIYEYAFNKPDKTIDLLEIGEMFYNDPEFVTNYAEENDYEINTSFKYDNREMKRFVRVDINIEGINLKFRRDKFKNGVIKTEGDTVLIKSEAIARQVRSELEHEQ